MLCRGANLHAARAAGRPTPLSLAREAETRGEAPRGSTAWLLLDYNRFHRLRLWGWHVGGHFCAVGYRRRFDGWTCTDLLY